MSKKFYSHLIEIESVSIELEKMELSPAEKMYLAQLIDSNLHQTILEAIFSQLNDDDKKVFIEHLTNGDEAKIWQLLNEKVENIEEKIKNSAEHLKKEMHKDIKISQKLKGKNQNYD